MFMQQWLDAAGIVDADLRRCYLVAGDRWRSTSLSSSEWKLYSWLLRLAPAALRPYLTTLLTMLRIADLRADSGDPRARLRHLDEWSEEVLAAIAAGGSDDPFLHAVTHTFGAWNLRTSYLEETFGASRRDTEFRPFATHDDLQRWAAAVTGAPLVLIWEIVASPGAPEAAESVMRAAGAAAQIADNLYDLAEDLHNGRLYLPLEDLERFGVTPEDLFAGREDPAVIELLAFEVGRVRAQMPRFDELKRWCAPPAYALLDGVRRGIEMMLDAVSAAGARVLRRAPPMRLYHNLTLLLSELPSSDVRGGDTPSAGASASDERAAEQPPTRAWRAAIVRAISSVFTALLTATTDGGDVLKFSGDALLHSRSRLRAVLCLESAHATGEVAGDILSIATGIEHIHVACAVHQAVLDRSPTRTDLPVPVPRHELEDTLLVGDGLYVQGLLSEIGAWDSGVPAERMLLILRLASRGLEAFCRAVLLESRLRGDLSVGVEQCLEVIRGKTAVSVRAACEVGGVAAGAPQAQLEALGRYGEALGMALQICEDLRPYAAEPHAIAASIATGVDNRQPTLPVLLARDLAAGADRHRLAELLAGGATSRAANRELGDLLVRSGAVEEASRRAAEYTARAREALAELPPSASRDRLAALIPTGGPET